MTLRPFAAGLALAFSCALGPAQADTVTAVFGGIVSDNIGFPSGATGANISVTMTGDSEAAGRNETTFPVLLEDQGDTASYPLSSLRFDISGVGFSFDETVSDGRLFVGDNIPTGGGTFDLILAQGTIGANLMSLVMGFDPATFAGTALDVSITNGLARTATEFQVAQVLGENNSELRANTGLRSLLIDPDPGNGGGGVGTPPPSPVPVPAGFPLLLLAMGGMAALRIRS